MWVAPCSSGSPASTQACAARQSHHRGSGNPGQFGRRELRQPTIRRRQHDGFGGGQFGEGVGESRPGREPGARYVTLAIAPAQCEIDDHRAAGSEGAAQLARPDTGYRSGVETEHARHVVPARPIALARTSGKNGNVGPSHLLQPGSGHRRAHAVIVDQHDARTPRRNVRVGFLHQLAAGSRAGAAERSLLARIEQGEFLAIVQLRLQVPRVNSLCPVTQLVLPRCRCCVISRPVIVFNPNAPSDHLPVRVMNDCS